ncbi:hypothetical protein D9758_007376 [Tetrapyrgos nigripes]|uniref:Uncharacterized protein n=1 Tax=Tetrapyrgos nigripes TaxID=182062 RepID=A0A8H5LL79_9AGAR|nr:hypothetical protein D9758_007376 [Tetrapyrgos nigripes]
MVRFVQLAALLPVLGSVKVYGWGTIGHEAVGYVAMPFLAPNALSFVQSTLGSQYSESLGPAATWADNIKSDHSYDWASNLHYVDAEGEILKASCSFCIIERHHNALQIVLRLPVLFLNRGIVLTDVTAIANYTSRVVDTSLSATQTQEALKFLGIDHSIDHFIGDLHQPLHVEAEAVGGNDIDVTCSGSSTNLHSLWDSKLVEKLVDENFSGSVTDWAGSLVDRIRSGNFTEESASWVECSSTTTPASRKRTVKEDVKFFLHPRAITPLECPLEWAKDSNKLDCSFVFTYDQFDDLCTSSYYNDAVPLIETQIAKAGYRLAAWLNVLFDGDN